MGQLIEGGAKEMQRLLVMVLLGMALFWPGASPAATAQLPRTGQISCYDETGARIDCATAGQTRDGAIRAGMPWPDPRFTDHGNGTVTDKLTGLMWTKNVNPMKSRDPEFDQDRQAAQSANDGAVTWQHALDYVKKLNAEAYLGYSDWHLPNIVELQSLQNYQYDIWETSGRAWPFLPLEHTWLVDADNTQLPFETGGYYDGYCWSSTSVFGSSRAYTQWGGWSGASDKSATSYVRPVRKAQAGVVELPRTGAASCSDAGGNDIPCAGTGQDADLQAGVAWPDPRFTDNGDETLTDQLTGLVWSKDLTMPGPAACTDGSDVTWQGALDYIDCLNRNQWLGFADWRLPNELEKNSLKNLSEPTRAWLERSGFIVDSDWPTRAWSSTNMLVYDQVHGVWVGGGTWDLDYTGPAFPVRGGLLSTVPLTLTKTGSGSGSVVQDFGGIDWNGNTGTALFVPGMTVTLTTMADAGSVFTGWSGACTGTSPCQVTMAAAQSVEANFAEAVAFGETLPYFVPQGTGTIAFTVNPDAVAECSLDGGAYAACTPPFGYSGLADGEHALTVRATDSAGHLSTPLTRSWRIYTPRPETPRQAEVPATGQIVSYAAGDDNDLHQGIIWPSPRFIDNADQTVTDRLTGLIWSKDASTPDVGTCNGGGKNWQGALDYVACLNNSGYLGFTDWRLPNITELKSLVDLQQNEPALPAGHPFSGFETTTYFFWSSNTYVYITNYAWGVQFIDGSVHAYVSKTYAAGYGFVWPVRGGEAGSGQIALARTGQSQSYAPGDDGDLQRGLAWPIPRFSDNLDQTITDRLTGLIWAEDASTPSVGDCSGGAKTWQEALDYVTCLNGEGYLGFSDWRLPNRNELASLLDRSNLNPALPDGHPFHGVQLNYYWASSTYVYASYTSSAWIVFVAGGEEVPYSDKTQSYPVWPVRGGRTSDLSVTLAGSGSGSVNADLGSIAWQGKSGTLSCERTSTVLLTANPAGGSTFAGWSGACSGSGTCQVEMSAAKSVTATFAVLPPSVTLTPGVASPRATGSSVTFTAAASGGGAGAYEYRFYWRSAAGGPWNVGRSYSASASWTWDSAALGLGAGSYSIMVHTRHVGSAVNYEAAKTIGYALVAPVPPTGVTLAANPASPGAPGAVVTFTAQALGGDARPYEYRFYWRPAAGGPWNIGRSYSASASWTWDSAALGLGAGTYSIMVHTRHVGSAVNYETAKTIGYALVVPVPPTGVALTANPASPGASGAVVTFTAQALGGDARPYEYRFYWRPTAGGPWNVGRYYSASASWTWDSAALNLGAGTYSIMVHTRHVGSAANYEAAKTLTFSLR